MITNAKWHPKRIANVSSTGNAGKAHRQLLLLFEVWLLVLQLDLTYLKIHNGIGFVVER